MVIPIPKLPFVAIGILSLVASVVMKAINRGDPAYWLTLSGVCALFAIAGT